MKFVILAVLAGMASLWPALARADAKPQDHLWYVLDFAGGECVPAALLMPASPTPALFDRNTRATGNTDSLRAGRDTQGRLRFLAITVKQIGGKPPVTMFWFPNRHLCGEGRTAAVAAGVISREAAVGRR